MANVSLKIGKHKSYLKNSLRFLLFLFALVQMSFFVTTFANAGAHNLRMQSVPVSSSEQKVIHNEYAYNQGQYAKKSQNNETKQQKKPYNIKSANPSNSDNPKEESAQQKSRNTNKQSAASAASQALKPLKYDVKITFVGGGSLAQSQKNNPKAKPKKKQNTKKNVTKKQKNQLETIQKDFEGASDLISLKEREVYTPFALGRRVEDDTITMKKILFTYGYYDSKVLVTTDKDETNKNDFIVNIKIDLGQRYKIKTLSTEYKRPLQDVKPCVLEKKEYDFEFGQEFEAENVLDTFDEIKTHLGTCGYPFAKVLSHKAIIDRDAKTVDLRLKIDQGPLVKFGITKVISKGKVPNSFIRNRSTLEEGEPYNQDKVDEYQDALSTTRLFTRAEIKRETAEADIKDGDEVPMTVSVTEGPPRTISAGVKYSTSDGIGFDASWMHKNMFGKADRFKIGGHLGQKEQSIELTYELPDFLKIDQTLELNLDFTNERNTAYRARSFGGSAVLQNELDDGWSYFYGLSYENSIVYEDGVRTRSGGIGIPLGVTLNRINDELNPTSGYKIQATITPEFGNFGSSQAIASSQIYGTYHHPLTEDERHVISAWSRLGLLFGADAASLPANRRLYGGGSGSVRGYGFQKLSPLNTDGKPIGGKSLFEFGIEPRFRVDKNWGGVVFIEGGTVSADSVPTFDSNLLFGAGFGVRYYTDFGPIRADVAFPFKRRKDSKGNTIDSAFQLYISIGQAF